MRRRSKGRATRKDLVHPYHGVHAEHAPGSVVEHCHVYAVRLRPGQMFCHVTAALLRSWPLPSHVEHVLPLHVGAVRPASPPRTRGVVGHRFPVPPMLQPVQGLPVTAPGETWAQLGDMLTLDELVAIADHLLTTSPHTREQTEALLRRRIDAYRRASRAKLHAALAEPRRPVLSPKETEVRLLLVRAGIPEPECNGEVFSTAGRYFGKPDLVWRAQRVGLEYEGKHHTEEEQVLYDVERRERYADHGWEIVRVTKHDLESPGRRVALVARVRRRLENRG